MTGRRLLVFVAMCLVGCHAATTAPTKPARAYAPQIVYPGTGPYQQRVASFKFTPEAAREAGGRPFGNFGPACVIDDWYLFSKPYKYKRIDLRGTYVNGMTGKVERRESALSLSGDNSILGTLKSFPSDMPDSVSAARVYK
jgi:hypothetical protein